MKTAVGEGETECMLSSYQSRDLLRRFSGGFSPDELAEANSSDSDEIELGLSLGGCFNSPNSHKNRILRTSSIPAILPCEVPQLFPLLRTCSLPEEDMQNKSGMKRKRKREELEDGTFLKLKKFEIENEGSWIRGSGPANGVSSLMASRWMGGAGLPSPLRKLIAPASQVSAMSEGSNSSGGSELESRSGQGFELSGFSHGSEIRSPSRFMTMSEHNIHKSPTFSPSLTCPSSKPPNCTAISKSIMKEMPLVSTKGEGPKGLKIEGFLYKYGRGEEVRIVCVCHGSFLTPAEFVKHAGGGDVAHPLRHIVVNPNRASVLS